MISDSSQLKRYSDPWTDKQLSHLIRRTTFGIPDKDYEFFKGKSMNECINALFATLAPPAPPDFTNGNQFFPSVLDNKDFVFCPENKNDDTQYEVCLKTWWMEVILTRQKNIAEKMVLFWHSHFAIEFKTVKNVKYCYHYQNILRQYATGNFKKLLKEITICPGMLVYLNGNLNDKITSNENYGRELQELYTIGKGPDSHYTESDVKAAARVLSGWKDDKQNTGSYFDPASHNSDNKLFSAFFNDHEIAGRSGPDGAKETDELIDMICSNPEMPKFLCRKLYRYFVHSLIDEKVEKNIISPLADLMIKSNYEVKPVLEAIFSSTFFYDPSLIGAMFKSPADYFIGMINKMDIKFSIPIAGCWLTYSVLEGMGLDLGDPPSVAGWPAHYEYPLYDRYWINSERLSDRNKIIKVLNAVHIETPFIYDVIGFVKKMQDPGDPKALMTECLHQLCPVVPGPGQIAHLTDVLNTDQNIKLKWSELWMNFQKEQSHIDLQDEVTTRLKRVFNIVLLLPEFQIM